MCIRIHLGLFNLNNGFELSYIYSRQTCCSSSSKNRKVLAPQLQEESMLRSNQHQTKPRLNKELGSCVKFVSCQTCWKVVKMVDYYLEGCDFKSQDHYAALEQDPQLLSCIK